VQLSLSRLAAVAVLAAGLSAAHGQKDDYTQPQSAPRPRPKWLKTIDQGTRDPRLKGYITPEGIKVEIVAEAPTVINPVGMTFADDGTPFVLEWVPSPGDEWREFTEEVTYKDGSRRKVATMKKRVPDQVKVLGMSKEARDKGTYDRARVILRDELPSSILLHDGWLYLSGRGTVRRYPLDKLAWQMEGEADKPKAAPTQPKAEVIAQGFCGFHHHQVSGMTIGNNGWLYLTSGDDDNYAEGSDGSRATVLRTGAVFRCRPDGSKLETFAIGFRNPYRDVAFDTRGNMFHVDNDNEDGSKFTGCRLMHIAEGNDFGWRLRQGARCCVPDPVRGAVFGELPGKVPSLLKTGRGSPAGLLIYNDTFFPKQYQGLLIYPDVFRRLIRAYRVEPKGASFKVAEEFELMKSDDPLFRPCQAVLGPDGAIYIVDWRTDSGGAGRLWGDGKHGRIYRLTWTGTKDTPAIAPRPMDSWSKIVKGTDEELMKALASVNASDRHLAQSELRRRGPRFRKALIEILTDKEQALPTRVAALGVLHTFWNSDVEEAVRTLFGEDEPDLRRLAVEALGHHQAARGTTVVGLLEDTHPAVRRAAALALARTAAPGTAYAVVQALENDEGKDVILFDGLVRAVEAYGKTGIDRLLALAESGDKKKLNRVVEVFTALRTRPAAEALAQLLKSPHLEIRQRADLLRSYSNYLLDPPISLDPALDYLLKNMEEDRTVKLAGLEALSVSGGLKGEKGRKLLLALLEDDDPALRLSVIRGCEDVRLKEAAPTLAKLLGNSRRPISEREAAAKALRNLGGPPAVKALKAILAEEDKAPERATFRLEVLRSLAALDPEAARGFAVKHLGKGDRKLQEEVIQLLGARAEGAREVGRLFLAKKLPREFLPQVSEALRRHAGTDATAAKMLSAVMKTGLLLSNKPEDVVRVRDLVRRQGNPQRGRALFLDSDRLACVRCHRLEGVGGSIGPDLTRVWDTHSLEKVMESMIEPSKEIKEGYQTWTAATKKGQVVSGLKIAQTPDEVVLRDASGKDIRIRTKDLESLEATKQSLMPDNVLATLSYGQFIDLVAFLKDRSAQESLRGLALEFQAVGPFAPDLKTPFGPEKDLTPRDGYTGKKPGEILRWREVTAGPTGLLNLRALFNQDRASAYVLTHVHSPADQKAQLLLGSNAARVWVNGEQVHEHTASRRAAADQDRVTVTLQKGWNPVLVKVVGEPGDFGLYLRFVGEGLRTRRTPEGK
jgi:quinoprotein glucose dehydrogenase